MKGCLSWDFCNKMLLTRWLHQQKLAYHSSGGWSPRSDASLVGSAEFPLPGLQIWLLFSLWPQVRELWRLSLFLEGHWSYQEGSTPGPQQNETKPNCHPKMHFQIPSHRGLRLHMWIKTGDGGAGQIFSPEYGNCFHISSFHCIHAWETSVLTIFCVCTQAVVIPSFF